MPSKEKSVNTPYIFSMEKSGNRRPPRRHPREEGQGVIIENFARIVVLQVSEQLQQVELLIAGVSGLNIKNATNPEIHTVELGKTYEFDLNRNQIHVAASKNGASLFLGFPFKTKIINDEDRFYQYLRGTIKKTE